jgi:hypothetical protein
MFKEEWLVVLSVAAFITDCHVGGDELGLSESCIVDCGRVEMLDLGLAGVVR